MASIRISTVVSKEKLSNSLRGARQELESVTLSRQKPTLVRDRIVDLLNCDFDSVRKQFSYFETPLLR